MSVFNCPHCGYDGTGGEGKHSIAGVAATQTHAAFSCARCDEVFEVSISNLLRDAWKESEEVL